MLRQCPPLNLVLCACPWPKEFALLAASLMRILANMLALGWNLYDPLVVGLGACCWVKHQCISGMAGGNDLWVSRCRPLRSNPKFTDRPTAALTIWPVAQLARALPAHGFLSATTFAVEPWAPHLRHLMLPPESIL